MTKTEVSLSRQIGNIQVQVLKMYNEREAREAFSQMNEHAQAYLWKVLNTDADFDPGDIPSDQADRSEILVEEMVDGGREDWNSFSWFVVTKASQPVYVSPDWPSAEEYIQLFCSKEV